MSSSNSKTEFDSMKYQVAREIGVDLKQGYNGNLSAKDAGKIGGSIVKKVFEQYSQSNNKQF